MEQIFQSTSENLLIAYDNIRKITTGQRDDYMTSCLLDYNYFNKYYKMIAIDLSKQQALDANPKAIQQVNFKGNLNRSGSVNDNTVIFCIIEEAKEIILDFHKEVCEYCEFILI